LLLIGDVRAIQQQEDGVAAIKTANGFLLVWNHPGNYFTLEIKGKEIRPLNSTEHVFLEVDGIIVQVQSVAISEFLKPDKNAGKEAQPILVAHRDWETKYIESTLLGKKISVQSSPQKLSNGREALFWKYDMPAGLNSEARKQLHLTSVLGDYVLTLNGVVTDKVKEEVVKQYLLDTVLTLKLSSKPINLQELQESIRRGASR